MKRNSTKKKDTQGESRGDTYTKHRLTLGLLATTALAGAALYYFYGSRKADEHREKFTLWFKDARDEVLREARKLKDAAFNKQNYAEIVKTVGRRYQDLKKFNSDDVLNFIKVVGAEWKQLGDKVKGKAQKVKRVAVHKETEGE